MRLDGIEVHYQRTGGDKPPVVLLHGLTANGACWTEVARELERDFDVVMPDARGHGKSGRGGEYRYEVLAADLLALLDALGLAAPVLIGHSMGGLTAALFAARNPKRVRALVLADPTLLSPERQREVHQSDAAGVLTESVADLQRRHPRRSPQLIALLAQARRQTDPRAFEVLAPPNPDFRQLVRALEAPALLVTGDSGVVSPELAAELAALNPRLQVAQLAEVGHGLHYDQPERFAAAVRSFLRSL